MRRALLFLCIVLLPTIAFAEQPMTRREGFLQLWQSIRRPAFPAKGLYADIPEDARGSLEIDYARARGILDEAEVFRPDDPLLLADALTWLFRTRNVVDDPQEVQPSTMSGILLRYPIANEYLDHATDPVTEEQLMQLMRLLDEALRVEHHEVSLYGEKFHGDGTAFGETFDMFALTAAHRSFPHNTLVEVTNVDNGKSVVVRINDRGPYVKGRDMDLSVAAFTSIAERSKGKIMTMFRRLGDATLVSQCGGMSPMQQRLSRSVILSRGVPHTLALGRSLELSSVHRFVVRGVRYPDGNELRLQDFVLEGEQFSFTPSVEGNFVLTVGTIDGKKREMTMRVVRCDA